ncbi:MAG: hypothetical protein FJ096_03275 [Deltaproteobacteria bacterium]|nr:hypothetical protein [Deltaproteobacteria bacterium]
MESICSALLARDLVSLEVLDSALEWQMLHGWDVPTGLLALGALKESAVLRLLSEFHELPVGPKGCLPELPEEVLALLPPSAMLRLNVYPYRRTSRTLHVAVSAPLSAEVEQELRALTELQLRPAIVPAVRLAEALARSCQGARSPVLDVALERLSADVPSARGSARGGAAGYRRMSESPKGVRVSRQQPGGVAYNPLTVPPHTEGPAPDSQGNWLARLSDADRDGEPSTLPPGRSSEPDDGAWSSRPPRPEPPPSRANPWLAGIGDLATTERSPESREVPESSRAVPPARGSLVPTIPAPSAQAPSDVPAPLTRRAPSTPPSAAPLAVPAFRHRGPLPPREALAFARKAEDVDVVLQVVARFARQYVERLLVFAVEGEVAEVRLAHGLGGAVDLLVRLDDHGLLAHAMRSGEAVLAPLGEAPSDRALAGMLARRTPGSSVAMAVPLALRGKVVVLLYGDDIDEPVGLDASTAVSELGALAVEEMARIVVAPSNRA